MNFAHLHFFKKLHAFTFFIVSTQIHYDNKIKKIKDKAEKEEVEGYDL